MAGGAGKAWHLGVLCLAVVLTLSVWFAGTAAVPALLAEGLVTPGRAGWLTAAVQLGFVAGTLVSAVLSLADRRDPRRRRSRRYASGPAQWRDRDQGLPPRPRPVVRPATESP